MTREEAIKQLSIIYLGEFDKDREAKNIAISALSEELSEDGTLTVHVSDGSKVNRVLVMGENIFGGLYYPDSAENKGDLISRQAVINKLNRLIEVEKLQGTDEMGYGRERVSAYENMLWEVKEECLYPPVENKGEWIEHRTKNGTVVALTCPKCLKSPKNAVRSDFCPNCGADMRGKAE